MYFIPIVKPVLTTDPDYGSYRLHDLEIVLTAGVTGRQGMFTPPGHLATSLVYPEVHVSSFYDLYFLQVLWDCWLFVIYVISLTSQKFFIHKKGVRPCLRPSETAVEQGEFNHTAKANTVLAWP
jgi:hypothetical protein